MGGGPVGAWSGVTHAVRSKNMNSSAFSCADIGLCTQACGKRPLLVLQLVGSAGLLALVGSRGFVAKQQLPRCDVAPPEQVARNVLSVHCVFDVHPVQKPATQVSPPVQFAFVVQALEQFPSPGVPPLPPTQLSTACGPPQLVFVEHVVEVEVTQSAASIEALAAPLQAPAQPWPLSTHWPLGHWLSAVHRQDVPAELHTPTPHEYDVLAVHVAGIAVGAWQPYWLAAPMPVHPAPAHTHLPPAPHCESALHTQLCEALHAPNMPAAQE
jgi:hypothetical protein